MHVKYNFYNQNTRRRNIISWSPSFNGSMNKSIECGEEILENNFQLQKHIIFL
jgi:hypothetical protein